MINIEYPHFMALTGSRLYGYHNDNSDYDYRGWILPPAYERNKLFGKFEQHVAKDSDVVIYSLDTWLRHLINGNTNILECLYSTDIQSISDWVLKMHESINPHILSKKFIRSIIGFSISEYGRLNGTSFRISTKNSNQKDAIENLCGAFQLTRIDRDFIVNYIESITDTKIIEHVPNDKIGEKRRKLIDEFGYDIKAACNAIRLLYQGLYLIDNGKLDFPIGIVELLKDIRNGDVDIKDINDIYLDYKDRLTTALTISLLPDKPNIDAVTKIYHECCVSHGS